MGYDLFSEVKIVVAVWNRRWKIIMQDCDDGFDAICKGRVDEIVIVVESLCVDRGASNTEGNYASPRN